ncbi:MAG: hypothetical protein QOH30_2996 [Baekduia sp.]|nr:hypothetical protein [Baekduia sp.]
MSALVIGARRCVAPGRWDHDCRMGFDTKTPWPGVLAHHDDSCATRHGGACTCGVTGFRARIEDPLHEGPILGPVFATPDEARAWRTDQQLALDAWHAASDAGPTVSDVIDEFLEAARVGGAVDARGHPYPESELGDLRWSLRALEGVDSTDPRSHLGELQIAALDAGELRALIDRLDAAGLSARRARSVIGAVRALLRYAAYRGLVPPSAPDLLAFGDPGETVNPLAPLAPVAPVPPVAPAPPAPPTAWETPMQVPMPTTGSMPTPSMPSMPTLPTLGSPTPRTPGMIPDDVIWMVLKIVTIVFALIALVLVAESV